MEQVILVDELDNPIGLEEKNKAHKLGLLHRAFSIFIFNEKGELLLQKRALSKYHSPGLWTNSCCSHPRENESLLVAANRRLLEEMGFACELHHQFHFIYKAKLDQGMTEHEFDHVFFGAYDGEILHNKDEVAEWQYKSLDLIQDEINSNPEKFTEWFKIIFNKVKELQHANHL